MKLGKGKFKKEGKVAKTPSVLNVLKPYKRYIVVLIIVALGINGLNLTLPAMMSFAIDNYVDGTFVYASFAKLFLAIVIPLFLLNYVQSILQTVASEIVGRDLRTAIAEKISHQSYAGVQKLSPDKLLTNLTSDIDSIKTFVSQAIVSMVSSVVTIIGASILLLLIHWQLALAVLIILPIIAGIFAFVLGKVRKLFVKTREVIDWLNKVINESILGAALVRVLNSQSSEYVKFDEANTEAKRLGLNILNLFSAMIPLITFVSSMATVIILLLGGHFVIAGSLSLGDFAAFNGYLGILIFPIFVIGFVSNIIAQATASYGRIVLVLNVEDIVEEGTRTAALNGEVRFNNVSLQYGQKNIIKNVSFTIPQATKTAIIGPTAAGKTQLLQILIGLVNPTEGTVEYDGYSINEYEKTALHQQIGFVFQDSILFNLSIRDNIAFSKDVNFEDIERAVETAELSGFIAGLPDGLDTLVSERGTSLSGGQKQRLMLARALALNPRIILLDDFTARVDTKTEELILRNIEKNYPDVTLISVTQKISTIEHYEKIILLMAGEVVAEGTHESLMKSSVEYVQIFESQQSTHSYE